MLHFVLFIFRNDPSYLERTIDCPLSETNIAESGAKHNQSTNQSLTYHAKYNKAKTNMVAKPVFLEGYW
jgi:hypothetical protein